MLNRVASFISRHQLLAPDERYLVAVSGGADSVCLLLVLRQLGYKVEAVHCNFHLRGDESNRDEIFVTNLCRYKGIELHLTHFDTASYASLHKVSIEVAARRLRYHYFEQLRQAVGAAGVCVAHHQDDVVETVMMNMVRGTGLRGLQGIRPRNGHVLRPLLCVGRGDIEQWLRAQHQDYVTDSTNMVPDMVRNQLRLNVMPLLRQTVPSADANVLTTARRVGQALRVYEDAMAAALARLVEGNAISIKQLREQPSAECVLYEWLSPHGFSPATIEAISGRLDAVRAGSEWTSDTHVLIVHQGRLELWPKQPERPVLCLPEAGLYVYDEETRFRVATTEIVEVERSVCVACLDAAKVRLPLTVRPAKTGDRFTPFGMKGSRLVSDFLTDLKLSVVEKRRQLVITDASGRIVWVVNRRPDQRFCIDEDTRNMLKISCIAL